MKRASLLIRVAIVALALCAGVLYAQHPARNVSAARHPNLAQAQRLIGQAFDKLKAAQAANEFDMGGHAQKAKDLLEQASSEIKQAAEAANKM